MEFLYQGHACKCVLREGTVADWLVYIDGQLQPLLSLSQAEATEYARTTIDARRVLGQSHTARLAS